MNGKKIQKKWNYLRAAQNLFLFLTPCFSFILFEYLTGNLSTLSPWYYLVNIGWYYAVYLVLFMITGRSYVTIPVASIFFYGLSVAEYFVADLRGRPIMPWDVFSLGTALTVAGNYVFTFRLRMLFCAAAVIVIVVLSIRWKRKISGSFKKQLLTRAACLGIVAGYACYFYMYLYDAWDMGINNWDPLLSYESVGFASATAISVRLVVVDKPEGYDLGRIEEIKDEYSDPLACEEQDVVTPVNIICIMNESLADLLQFGDFDISQDYFPFLRNLKENTIYGHVVVPVFGSGTSSTEFEFLTGDSVSLLPSGSNPYQFNVREGMPSLVSTLKDQGYEAIAVHPYAADNWNRKQSFADLGFDEFIAEEDFEGYDLLRNYVSDKGDYDKLIELVCGKSDPDDKLFLFNVTMQNHGGYTMHYDNFEQGIGLTGDMEATYAEADQYLSLMKKSDEALEYLITYFEAVDEPTIIVMFGDHLPELEDEFYDTISEDIERDARHATLVYYKTPFIIWTNYETESIDAGDFSSFYLSSIMLERTGLKLTPFNRFLLTMKEDLPIIHLDGCYDNDGIFYSWKEAEEEGNPYYEFVRDYEYLVYNHIYDHRHTSDLFYIAD